MATIQDGLEAELRFVQETTDDAERVKEIRAQLAALKGDAAPEAPVEKAVAPRSARVSKSKAEG